MTIDQQALDATLAVWQKALRLRDWAIDARVARRHEMTGDNQAEVKYDAGNKRAVVKVLDPTDYSGDAPQDPERSVVHELLHLHFAALDPLLGGNPLADLALEQGINACAVLMVELRRSAQAAALATDSAAREADGPDEERP